MKYIISGVAFTGNQGAAGMTTAIIQNLTQANPEHQFYVLSYYPTEDAKRTLDDNVTVLSATPQAVILNCIISCWAALCIALHLPPAWYKKNKFIATVLQADYWLDTSGISFVDGREKFLIYNVMSILPALWLQCPVVKMPQALGPFQNPINRLAAKAILPRLALICARGQQTASHLAALNLTNYAAYPDIAFSLRTTAADQQTAKDFIPPATTKVIGVSPSQVVYNLCRRKRIPYLPILKQTIEILLETDCRVVIFAHSGRSGTTKRHNNDLPLLDEFSQMLSPDPRVSIVRDELTAAELRELIRACDVLLVSRFHALISAICTMTPTVTLGWSHKYDEVLQAFGIEQYSIDCAEIDADKLVDLVRQVDQDKDAIIERIRKTLPQIHDRLDALYAWLQGD